MCDLGMILGLGVGMLQMAGEAETEKKNKRMIKDQQRAEMTVKSRELIIEQNAANKEGYKATMEMDRATSLVNAQGAGMMGSTAGLRSAEQSRQGALSLQAAKDRSQAGAFNYTSGVTIDAIEAKNKIAVNTTSGMTKFANVVSSGVGSYGAFG